MRSWYAMMVRLVPIAHARTRLTLPSGPHGKRQDRDKSDGEKGQIVKSSVALIAGMLAATPAIATGCGPPDYGSDAASSAAFIKNFSPFFRNTDETAGQFLTRICNAKFGGRAGGLEGLRASGYRTKTLTRRTLLTLPSMPCGAGETSSKRTAAADSSQTSQDGHIVDLRTGDGPHGKRQNSAFARNTALIDAFAALRSALFIGPAGEIAAIAVGNLTAPESCSQCGSRAMPRTFKQWILATSELELLQARLPPPRLPRGWVFQNRS
jgi:hypothetical protein